MPNRLLGSSQPDDQTDGNVELPELVPGAITPQGIAPGDIGVDVGAGESTLGADADTIVEKVLHATTDVTREPFVVATSVRTEEQLLRLPSASVSLG
jgi:hypothetical protein